MRTSTRSIPGLLALAFALLAAPVSANALTAGDLPGVESGGGLSLTATSNVSSVPQGGQFSPTITVTNNGSEPVQVDFWLAVADSTVYLHRNTIPVGGPFSRTYTHTVDPDFRPGRYNVTVYVGDFATGTVLASDSYPLQVTEATKAPGAMTASAVTAAGVSPNPFVGRANVSFTLAEASAVRLVVYDALGRQVAVLVDGQVEAGSHTAVFDASSLASGTYVYRLVANGQVQTGRLTLAR
jgi:hypothetical protein